MDMEWLEYRAKKQMDWQIKEVSDTSKIVKLWSSLTEDVVNSRGLPRCKKWLTSFIEKNIFSIIMCKSITSIWGSLWAGVRLASQVCQFRYPCGTFPLGKYTEIHNHIYAKQFTHQLAWLQHTSPTPSVMHPFSKTSLFAALQVLLPAFQRQTKRLHRGLSTGRRMMLPQTLLPA